MTRCPLRPCLLLLPSRVTCACVTLDTKCTPACRCGGMCANGNEEGAPPAVVFSVAGRCVDEGLTLSPEVTVDEANALLERLSELAGRK